MDNIQQKQISRSWVPPAILIVGTVATVACAVFTIINNVHMVQGVVTLSLNDFQWVILGSFGTPAALGFYYLLKKTPPLPEKVTKRDVIAQFKNIDRITSYQELLKVFAHLRKEDEDLAQQELMHIVQSEYARRSGNTPSLIRVEDFEIEILKREIRYQLARNVSSDDTLFKTAIEALVTHGHFDALKRFQDDSGTWTLLLAALVKNGYHELLRGWKNENPSLDLHAARVDQKPPIVLAIENLQVKTVELLLDDGAKTTFEGKSLFSFIQGGMVEPLAIQLIELLYAKGIRFIDREAEGKALIQNAFFVDLLKKQNQVKNMGAGVLYMMQALSIPLEVTQPKGVSPLDQEKAIYCTPKQKTATETERLVVNPKASTETVATYFEKHIPNGNVDLMTDMAIRLINEQGESYTTVCMLASWGRVDVLEKLKDCAMSSLGDKWRDWLNLNENKEGRTPITFAVECNRVKAIEFFLKDGARINQASPSLFNYVPALQDRQKTLALIDFLFKNLETLSERDIELLKENERLIEILKYEMINPHAHDGVKYLIVNLKLQMTSKDIYKFCEKVCSKGTLVKLIKLVDWKKTTPIHILAAFGRLDVIEALKQEDPNVDLDAAQANNKRPISIAIANQQLETIQYLLKSGAHANKSDQQSSLFVDLRPPYTNDLTEIIELLYSKGARLMPEDVVALREDVELVDFLRQQTLNFSSGPGINHLWQEV